MRDAPIVPATPVSGGDGDRRVVIDRRPMVVILLSRFRVQVLIALLFGVFGLALGVAPPDGLSQQAWRALCLFGLCITLWVASPIPLAITSLLAIALIPLLGILDAATAYSYFGSKAVFFIMGAFILAAALVGCGLSQRLTMVALRRFGKTPTRLIATVYVITAIGSCLMSEHAVAAMAFPIVWELHRSLKLRPGSSRMGKGLFFALAWGCIIGGTMTILGGGRGPLAIGILEKTTGGEHTISFMEYMIFDLPLVLILMAAGWLILRLVYKPEIDSVQIAIDDLGERMKAIGKTTLREKLVGIVMVLTVALWLFSGEELGIANIAILSTALLFVLGLMVWKDVEENVNWGVLLMYGGAICLGSALADTGAALWLTERILGDFKGSPEALMLALGALTLVLTEFMSNSAVIAVLMPPALSLAGRYGIDPKLMTMAIVLPSNFAFMLPMATPATAIAYSSGTFRPVEALRAGVVLNLVGFAALVVLIYVYWPLLGRLGLVAPL